MELTSWEKWAVLAPDAEEQGTRPRTMVKTGSFSNWRIPYRISCNIDAETWFVLVVNTGKWLLR